MVVHATIVDLKSRRSPVGPGLLRRAASALAEGLSVLAPRKVLRRAILPPNGKRRTGSARGASRDPAQLDDGVSSRQHRADDGVVQAARVCVRVLSAGFRDLASR